MCESRRLLLAFCVSVKLATLLLAGDRYGYLSDELYFLDAAERLALGYVDFPPAIAWLMALVTSLFGDAVWVLRAVATAIGTLVLLLAVDVCRLLGGRGFAQWLTAIVLVTAPAFVSIQAILTMNVLDQLWWVLSFWLLLRYFESNERRFMLWLGVVFGLGILSKLSILALGLTLSVSFVCWQPGLFRRTETWIAGLAAVLLASPYIVWQLANDWPLLEFVSAYNSASPEPIVIDQPLFGLFVTMHPPYALIWFPGLVFGLLGGNRALRTLGTAAVLCLALFLYAGVKFYFATPLFILFVAAGAVWWESRGWLQARPLLANTVLILVLISGLPALPIGAPLLPADTLQELADFIRDGEQGYEGSEPARVSRYFPQFAEMHGWPELAALTVSTYEGLHPDERENAVIVAAYYGQVGALNRLGGDSLPTAYSGHMSYDRWHEGVDLGTGLYVGFERDLLESLFGRVEEKGRLDCQRCMAREDGLRVFFVENPKVSNAELAEHIKRYYFF